VSTTHRIDIGEITERTTPLITFQFLDHAGAGFKPTTLTLTIYDEETAAIVNSRTQTVALDTLITVDVNGNAEWIPASADTQILNADGLDEIHIALLEWTWAVGAKHGKIELEHKVKNLAKVPA
jgi:hypothetical protein